MAISTNNSILSMLKVYYKKEGIQNLLFRNSPLLRKIQKERVEGKEQRFSAMYSRGGAAGGSFTTAKALAATVAGNVEFCVTPGQLFSVYSMNAKEVAASKSNAGAYMRIGGAKMFAASESFRKTLAAALYGSGYGEIGTIADVTFETATPVDINLSESAVIKIDVGSKLVVKATKETPESSAIANLTVNSINGTTVNVTPDAAGTGMGVVCLAGSMNGNNPILPVGLNGWLPVTKKRTGSDWETYIKTSFFGVDRSVSADRLAGGFYDGTAETDTNKQKKSYAVTQLIKKLRRQGSLCDMIVMNDNDFLNFAAEIEASNTYYTQTSTKSKKYATIGLTEISAAFSTNYIENIIDDPYCPEGRFYVLSSDAVEMWCYTNVEKALNDGVENNNAGKQDPMTMDGDDKGNDPLQLLVDDLFTISGGEDTVDGPATMVTLNLFGSFVIINPSVCGVGEFYGSTDFAAA